MIRTNYYDLPSNEEIQRMGALLETRAFPDRNPLLRGDFMEVML
jgi:hypothetical protein